MPSTSALSEFKLKLIQCRVFKIVVRDGEGIRNSAWGDFLPGEWNKGYEIRTKLEQKQ